MNLAQIKICERALEKFGEQLQITTSFEEMAELTQALSKYLRGIGNLNNIAEEIADVEIMLKQLKINFKIDEHVECLKDYKLERLDYLIKSSAGIRT